MTVNTARQPMGTDVFKAENRRRCERYVRLIQGRLDKAVADNDKEKIRAGIQECTGADILIKVREALQKTARKVSVLWTTYNPKGNI